MEVCVVTPHHRHPHLAGRRLWHDVNLRLPNTIFRHWVTSSATVRCRPRSTRRLRGARQRTVRHGRGLARAVGGTSRLTRRSRSRIEGRRDPSECRTRDRAAGGARRRHRRGGGGGAAEAARLWTGRCSDRQGAGDAAPHGRKSRMSDLRRGGPGRRCCPKDDHYGARVDGGARARASACSNWTDEQFLADLASAFRWCGIERLSPAIGGPPRVHRWCRQSRARSVIGPSLRGARQRGAETLHPVAGQGFNLGLRRCGVEHSGATARHGRRMHRAKRIGERAMLERYAAKPAALIAPQALRLHAWARQRCSATIFTRCVCWPRGLALTLLDSAAAGEGRIHARDAVRHAERARCTVVTHCIDASSSPRIAVRGFAREEARRLAHTDDLFRRARCARTGIIRSPGRNPPAISSALPSCRSAPIDIA